MRLIPYSQFGLLLHCGFLALLTSGSEYMYQWAESKQFDWMTQLSLSQQLSMQGVNVAADLRTGLTSLQTLPLHTVNWSWGMECVSVCWEIWGYCHKMSLNLSQGSSTSQRTTPGKTCSETQVTSQASGQSDYLGVFYLIVHSENYWRVVPTSDGTYKIGPPGKTHT